MDNTLYNKAATAVPVFTLGSVRASSRIWPEMTNYKLWFIARKDGIPFTYCASKKEGENYIKYLLGLVD